jgi:CheY-like chemotaxis protein
MAKVLVVDDHEDLRGVVRELLEMSGHAVACANNVPEARRAMSDADDAGTPFDVVVADYHMPGENGFEFLRQLAIAKRCLTVLCSGDDNHQSSAAEAGIDDFWMKGGDAFFDQVEKLDGRLAMRGAEKQ